VVKDREERELDPIYTFSGEYVALLYADRYFYNTRGDYVGQLVGSNVYSKHGDYVGELDGNYVVDRGYSLGSVRASSLGSIAAPRFADTMDRRSAGTDAVRNLIR
jgi:hypothetical protein